MNSCKVSVIVPNYNYARYLRSRIDSVLAQTFGDFELILLDDASTDGSASILEAYKSHPQVACVDINARNTGSPFAQWFKGIALARGTYIWLAEADDLAAPTFLAEAVAAMDRHPRAAYCFAGSTLIDEQGRPLPGDVDKWGRKQQTAPDGYAVFPGRQYVAHNLYWRNYVANASSALFRRAAFREACPEACLTMRYSGDWLFWFKLALTGDVIELYRKLNYFRQHTQKVSVRAEGNGGGKREDIAILRQIEAACPELSRYKRALRHGQLYNRIHRLRLSPDAMYQLDLLLKSELNTGKADGCLAHLNHFFSLFCPWLLTMKRDRLSP